MRSSTGATAAEEPTVESEPAGRPGAGDSVRPDPGDDAEAGTRRTPRQDLLALALMFVTTRLALLVIGLVSRAVTPGPVGHPQPMGLGVQYSRFPFLDVWGQWDSSWYLTIAVHGYQPGPIDGPFANYGFFPLYPLLSRWVGWAFGSEFVGGLIVSNVAFLVACVFLYRLVNLDHDSVTSRRAVKYLFACPAAFIFSAMMSESLYLALVVMCFYFARRRRWWVVAALGFLVALTRVPGVLLALPLAWIYLQQRGFSIRRIRPDVLALASFPLGILCFMWFEYHLNGDALAFVHIQTTAWGHSFEDPVSALWRLISGPDIFASFAAWYSLGVLVLIFAFLKKLGVAYGVFALTSILLPLSSGGGPWGAMPRYTAVIFPLFIVGAEFTRRRPALDQSVLIAMALTQGFLMAFWANNSLLVV